MSIDSRIISLIVAFDVTKTLLLALIGGDA